MSIIKKSLRELIDTQGILLEHQTHSNLLRYFNESNAFSVEKNAVSETIISSSLGKQPIEIDVYFELLERYDSLPTMRKLPNSKNGPMVSFSNERILKIVLIECKGHPSQGFLLSRRSSSLENVVIEHEVHKQKGLPDSYSYFIQQTKIPAIDWAHFYRLTEQDIRRIAKNKELEISYKEDASKFYKAVQQAIRNIYACYDSLRKGKLRDRIERFPYIILPIIVTNAPILLMNISSAAVLVQEVPWTVFINHDRPTHQSYSQTDFKNIYVVNYDHIVAFNEVVRYNPDVKVPNYKKVLEYRI